MDSKLIDFLIMQIAFCRLITFWGSNSIRWVVQVQLQFHGSPCLDILYINIIRQAYQRSRHVHFVDCPSKVIVSGEAKKRIFP